ncbi:MAG: TIGR03905 family TSCPD domain-containing protein [Bacteroides sp.]
MKYTYKTKGTCSSLIELELEEGIVKEVAFVGGCNGNLQGIASLIKGMPAKEVCKRLEGIKCGRRSTSCPDQLSQAIHEMGY